MPVTSTSSASVSTLNFMTGISGSDLNLLKNICCIEDHAEMQPTVSDICVWLFSVSSFWSCLRSIRGQIWEVVSGTGPLSCAIMALIIQGSYFKPLIWKRTIRRRQRLLVFFCVDSSRNKRVFLPPELSWSFKSLYYPSSHRIFYCCLYLFLPWEICKHYQAVPYPEWRNITASVMQEEKIEEHIIFIF